MIKSGSSMSFLSSAINDYNYLESNNVTSYYINVNKKLKKKNQNSNEFKFNVISHLMGVVVKGIFFIEVFFICV